MSAFIVNKKHIDAILTVWASCGNDIANIDQIGQMLQNANIKSVNFRYSEDTKSEQYKWQPIPGITKIQAYKAIGCLDYQSCETDDWRGSEAEQFLKEFEEALASEIISNLPEYNSAQWEIQ